MTSGAIRDYRVETMYIQPLTREQVRDIANAYVFFGQLCKTPNNDENGLPAQPAQKPDIQTRHKLIAALTPDLKGALDPYIKAKTNIIARANVHTHNLVSDPRPEDELFSYALVGVICPAFGIEVAGALNDYCRYDGRQRFFVSNTATPVDDRNTPKKPSDRFSLYDLIVQPTAAYRTHWDKHRAIKQANLLGSQSGMGVNLRERCNAAVQRQFEWLKGENAPPESVRRYQWISWMAAYNLASVLPPMFDNDTMRHELKIDTRQGKEFLEHPAGRIWSKNYQADMQPLLAPDDEVHPDGEAQPAEGKNNSD